jgi:hypothetical protein
MVEMSSGALEVVLSYVEAAQQARRSQRDDDWQRVSELLAEDVVWQAAGDGTGQLWRARRAALTCWPPCIYPRTAGRGYRPRP